MAAEKKSFAVKLNKYCGPCQGCKAKVKTAVDKVDGVHSSWNFDDANEGMLTVSSTVDPQALLAALREEGFKNAELLSEKQFDSENAGLLSEKQFDTKSSLQIVAIKLFLFLFSFFLFSFFCSLCLFLFSFFCSLYFGMSTTEENKTGQSISHEHDRLELKNYNKPFRCSGCKELGFGPRFKCDCCDYELHKECKECCKSKCEIPHKFLKGYTFEFFDKLSNKKCHACGKHICGFRYHSEAKGKSLDLHPCCSKLQSKICIDGDDFELHDKVLSKCKWCDKKTGISGWSYISARNKCLYHVYCVSEMVDEAWMQGLIDKIDSSISMALAKINPQILLAKKSKEGKRNSDHHFSWRIMKMFPKAIVGVLLGDPIMIVGLVVELVTYIKT